ncbi:hypothetical protein B0H11DRAFT_1903425 [Mycena galericulata]|nr:hypothetical protein B0H11DRAFT_1903425 [Mycena galericulata]
MSRNRPSAPESTSHVTRHSTPAGPELSAQSSGVAGTVNGFQVPSTGIIDAAHSNSTGELHTPLSELNLMPRSTSSSRAQNAEKTAANLTAIPVAGTVDSPIYIQLDVQELGGP